MTSAAKLEQPEALLFDLDGVIADVSGSYRQSILETAATYGVEVDAAAVREAKAAGDANNDWELTHRLLGEGGVATSLAEVTARFEAIYQGTPEQAGLRRTERLLAHPELFERLAARLPLGIVTGRPRADAERFLRESGIASFFRSTVCMEDAPSKPDPAPVRLLMERLSVQRAWLIGDTPDDMRAARAAGVMALGIIAPGDEGGGDGAGLIPKALRAAGAARILDTVGELEALLLDHEVIKYC